MLIEIHMIQNHSPANLNRDDLGAPKTCVFGGVTRARISSQSIKRSIRNPGNPGDIHNRELGSFAEAMKNHIGCRTKYFPWLVEQELKEAEIPEGEHRLIVLKAKLIAESKEKEERKATAKAPTDPRPRTRQLIHLGPDHAKYFVAKLAELRDQYSDQYNYFLNPVVGFQEMVREFVSESDLNEREQEKVVKACWTIAKCRMSLLLQAPKGKVADPEPELEDDQPGAEHAKLVAERLSELHTSDLTRFNDLTRAATTAEKRQIKEDAPTKPSGMDAFISALKGANRCDAVDIALFGRMTTSEAFEDVEAAMQVAHAISTHGVVNEVDYFTAVDDLGKAGGGAGHVDEAMFNSACFYKYFSLDWDQLVHNLAGPEPDLQKDARGYKKWEDEVKSKAEQLAACTLGHFIRAAALSTPSGKQNSFASHCEACGILVEIKKSKLPTSYANAFAEPVERIGKPDDDGPDEKSIEGRSVACLGDHAQSVSSAYGIESKRFWYSPKLWRFPLRYWDRTSEENKTAKEVVADRFSVLGGVGNSKGLVEAVVNAVVGPKGLTWSEIEDAGRTPVKEA